MEPPGVGNFISPRFPVIGWTPPRGRGWGSYGGEEQGSWEGMKCREHLGVRHRSAPQNSKPLHRDSDPKPPAGLFPQLPQPPSYKSCHCPPLQGCFCGSRCLLTAFSTVPKIRIPGGPFILRLRHPGFCPHPPHHQGCSRLGRDLRKENGVPCGRGSLG